VVVPRQATTVTVLGAVARSGAVRYVAGERCRDYLQQAGGVREDAAVGRMVAVHRNGAVAPLGPGGPVEAGDVIVVPTRHIVRTVHTESSWKRWLGSIVSIVTAAIVF